MMLLSDALATDHEIERNLRNKLKSNSLPRGQTNQSGMMM